jgi:hypothetical protein
MGASVTFIFFGILSLFGIIYTKIFVRDSSTLIEIFYENEIPIYFDQEKIESNSDEDISNNFVKFPLKRNMNLYEKRELYTPIKFRDYLLSH